MSISLGVGSVGAGYGQKEYFLNAGIDLAAAAEEHINWSAELLKHINAEEAGDWSPKEAGLQDNCELGGWLRGVGKMKYGGFSAFRRLEAEHALFHGFAGVILAHVLEGKHLAAHDLLRNEFAQATRRILMAINDLNELQQQSC